MEGNQNQITLSNWKKFRSWRSKDNSSWIFLTSSDVSAAFAAAPGATVALD